MLHGLGRRMVGEIGELRRCGRRRVEIGMGPWIEDGLVGEICKAIGTRLRSC